MEIKITEYLTQKEIKQLCIDHVKDVLNTSNERILVNMAYEAAFHILDSALTPEMMQVIKDKTLEVISNPSSFSIFRKKDVWGSEDSVAYLEVKKAVEEHKVLINPLVKKAILERNYIENLPNNSDCITDFLLDALRKGLAKE